MSSPENRVIEDTMNRLRGRCCGLIESWGLPEKQERGMIQSLKSLSYDAQKEITDSISQGHTGSK